MNSEKIILDNGLTIYLLQDNTKHVSLANLIVNFGGIDSKYKLDKKIKNIKQGCAHFLEHVVLESTKYGDLMELFSSYGIRSNGLTSLERTEFYIDTVKDFNINLSTLIKGIHSPIFDKNKIDDIRKPILEEKRRSLDNKYSNLYNANVKTYINNKKFKSILGDMSDIKNININDLESVFKAFYRPSNEILIISGNFDKTSVLKTIKDAYNELSFNNNLFERINIPYRDKVNKKNIIVRDNTNIGRTIITFKINITDLKPYDKLILDTYIYSFLRMNFGVTSKLNKKLINDNIIVGNLGFVTNAIDGYYIVKIEANTNKKKDFVSTILNYISLKNFIFDQELFDLYKKGYIIDLIVRNDNIYSLLEPFIQNIIFFNYEGLDNVGDIENMNFNEFRGKIGSLDFSNYSITELRKY